MNGVQQFGSLNAILMAIEAGVDMFIFRESNEQTLDIINQLVETVESNDILKELVIKSNYRIQNLKQKFIN